MHASTRTRTHFSYSVSEWVLIRGKCKMKRHLNNNKGEPFQNLLVAIELANLLTQLWRKSTKRKAEDKMSSPQYSHFECLLEK